MSKDERVLITGCGGMLGQAIYAVFSKNYDNVLATDIDLNEPWLKHMDVRDIRECENVFESFKPNIVIHLAALVDLEDCEKNPDNAWMTNALGTENIILNSNKHNAKMIYISTAGIFDGNQEYFNDYDLPNPLGFYAKSKYHGEKMVQQMVKKHFVFRAGWMMGGGVKKDKKFMNKIYLQIKKGTKELFVVDDKLGTPTYTHDFANGIYKIIQTDYYGLYNQVCEGSCSRYDVAKEFVKLLGLDNEIKITIVNSHHFIEEYFAPRPASEKLINLKLNQRKINYMRDWKVCLAEYALEFKKDYETNVKKEK